ncbi:MULTISPECIES: hypothetical protein [unclassified Streptomyces]|uniref:hypothetical protein n=1 Tax=unclassified Streptomyces TaxID=2593676 RepID=UPI0033182DB4
MQQVELGAAQIDRALDRRGLAQPQLADDRAADAQRVAAGVRQPGVRQVELARDAGAAQIHPAPRAQPHRVQIGADREHLGVQGGAAGGVEHRVVEAHLPADDGPVQLHHAVRDQLRRPYVRGHLGVVELEHGRLRGLSWPAEPRPVGEEPPRPAWRPGAVPGPRHGSR